MPYTTIQDINTSQSVFARLFNVGTVSLFSAYDNNQIKLENISDPSKVEEIIFSHMMGYRNFQPNPRNYISKDPQETRNQFVSRNDEDLFNQDEYYDEYEPITPIDHENQYQRREYEYYPEEFSSRVNLLKNMNMNLMMMDWIGALEKIILMVSTMKVILTHFQMICMEMM